MFWAQVVSRMQAFFCVSTVKFWALTIYRTCSLSREVPWIENLLRPQAFLSPPTFFLTTPYPTTYTTPPPPPPPPPPPLLSVCFTPSSRDFITICNGQNKPSFFLLLYFLSSVYLPQHILLIHWLPCHFYRCVNATTNNALILEILWKIYVTEFIFLIEHTTDHDV